MKLGWLSENAAESLSENTYLQKWAVFDCVPVEELPIYHIDSKILNRGYFLLAEK